MIMTFTILIVYKVNNQINSIQPPLLYIVHIHVREKRTSLSDGWRHSSISPVFISLRSPFFTTPCICSEALFSPELMTLTNVYFVGTLDVLSW